MPEPKAELYSGNLEDAFFELVRRAVRVEIQDISRRNEDRLLTIDEVAQRLAVSKDWIYRNGRRLTFTRKLGAEDRSLLGNWSPKMAERKVVGGQFPDEGQ